MKHNKRENGIGKGERQTTVSCAHVTARTRTRARARIMRAFFHMLLITIHTPENLAIQAGQFSPLVPGQFSPPLDKIESPQALLRVLLVHIADGKSLRAASVYARETGICDINDVALLYRLKESEEWLHWIAMGLLKELNLNVTAGYVGKKRRIRLVDGTSISEPGSTGTDWRIHYCFRLDGLICDHFSITDPKTGESFERYPVGNGDLMIGDRGYCRRGGVSYVLRNGGQVMVRFHSTGLPLLGRNGKPWPVLEHLRTLEEGMIGDWDVWIKDGEKEGLIKGRLCSIRKSQEAIDQAVKQIRQKASKKGNKTRPETIEYAEYVTVFTTLNRHGCNGTGILTLYRGRWQIELVFKRLKSIAGVGCLPKYNHESSKAWLYGKLLVTLLTERLRQEAEIFSPWGYPLSPPRQCYR